MVGLSAEVVGRYERFTLYNSPYPAHDRGHAADVYPGENAVASPVAGEVLDARTVRCPPREYAVDEDHLVVVGVDEERSPGLRRTPGDPASFVARLLHVDPAVGSGDEIAVGDPLGTLVRSGFFGRWVDNHLHLEFRDADRDPYRARGSLPLALGVDVSPLPWDGTGTVVETGPTHALVDAPDNDADGFAAMATDDGRPLDGGLAHYSGGGLLDDCGLHGGGLDGTGKPGDSGGLRDGHGLHDGDGRQDGGGPDGTPGREGPVHLLGSQVGVADGRDVTWNGLAVLADVDGRGTGRRATGLSLFASRVEFGAKLVFHEGHDLAVGDDVRVSIRPSEDPIHLG
jgi:hypothetical protein